MQFECFLPILPLQTRPLQIAPSFHPPAVISERNQTRPPQRRCQSGTAHAVASAPHVRLQSPDSK